ncbi:MAG: 2Fe-2S iron-sulfur cluster binding domain-containing protein [Actinobacteria bacterium]|nr:2Fe-2S iron-sulfur cluster binding domain-containing protein [Actinomycetota bacterium]
MAETYIVKTEVNGKRYQGRAEARTTLADFLRDQLNLTGTHLGCEHGVCGACTILMEGRSIRSCLMFAVQADGKSLETIEGLAESDGTLHPIQEAFSKHHALQCGFCTPGFLMTIIEYLAEGGEADEETIRQRLSGNLCRCTGYQGIVKAVGEVAARSGSAPTSG